jgi:hypothetical protein
MASNENAWSEPALKRRSKLLLATTKKRGSGSLESTRALGKYRTPVVGASPAFSTSQPKHKIAIALIAT